MSESFHDLSYICFFILGIQNFCRKSFESIFTNDLIFDLDVEHAFLGIEFVQIQTSRWTKWDGVIKPFHVPSEQFDLNPVLDSKFVLRMMSYLTLSLSKTITIKRFDVPVLSILGNLKSCIVMTLNSANCINSTNDYRQFLFQNLNLLWHLHHNQKIFFEGH
jgi:hypothetical protein